MKKRLIICLSIIIGFLLVFFVSRAYAILKNKNQVSNQLSMASWSVQLNQNGVDDELILIPDVLNASYTLNITGLSDVDISYAIVVSGLSSGVEVKLDSGSFQTQVNNSVTFTNAGSILYSDNNKNRTHTITFKANTNAALVNDQDVDIDVVFKQIV